MLMTQVREAIGLLRCDTLILDIDNTLFDWLRFWNAAFGALLDVLLSKTSIPREELLDEIQKIHRRVGTSEYAFVLQDLRDFVQSRYQGNFEILTDEAVRAYRIAREQTIFLYPGVKETLQKIRADGAFIVALTESTAFHTIQRIRKLDLDGIIDVVYSPPDYSPPSHTHLSSVRNYPPIKYDLRITKHKLFDPALRKPDSRLLTYVIGKEHITPATTAYVGDSLTKDISMAQQVGILDIHARYGLAHNKEDFSLLTRVTHWSPEEVKAMQASILIHPSLTLSQSFSEISSLLTFSSHG